MIVRHLRLDKVNHFEKAVEALLIKSYKKVEVQAKVPWMGLFGQRIIPDFVVEDRLCFEVKYQSVRGTADQKLVYSVQQIKDCHKLPTYLLYAGDGWSEGAIEWLTNQPSDKIFLGAIDLTLFLETIKRG
ncbi:MAG: PD-(D/E)XK nuclease superfamily protein [Microcoleus sp.]